MVGFTRTWQRPPTAQELAGLIEDYIREEVLYREAVAMGLDRDDIIVRRRLRQKLEFLTEETAERHPLPRQSARSSSSSTSTPSASSRVWRSSTSI